MQSLKILATSAALLMGASGLALAQSDHGHSAEQPTTIPKTDGGQHHGNAGGQGGMMQMMPMMMNMHGQMGGQGGEGGMGMMDRGMMQMMMRPGMMGMPSAEEATAAMQARLAEFDADGNGSLSLGEFETLHSAVTRELMVDRFQHLDADGDGAVTQAEMTAPAERMKMHGGMGAPAASAATN